MKSNDLKIKYEHLLKNIDVSDALKRKILDKAFKEHYLYAHLPIEVAQLVKETVDSEKLADLSFYSYLYFSAFIFYDKFIDNQLDDNLGKDILTNYLFTIKEKALLGLATLFEQKNEFWNKFENLKKTYFKYSDNNYLEKENVSEESGFLLLAKQKGILAHNFVYAIKYLFGEIHRMEDIISGLDYFHIGLQIYDDYLDIKEDYKNGQPNYILFKISNRQIEGKSFEYMLKLAYIDNTIIKCLNQAVENLTEAKIIFNDIGIALLHDKSVEIINFIESEIHFIKASIIKAKDKSKNKKTFNDEISIEKSIDLSLSFLENNLNENSLWRDFLTNAGYGQEWITGYVLSMLGEVDPTMPFLKKPLHKLLNSKGSYNDYIVQDGDSTNFLLKALSIYNKEPSGDIINNWLQFSKSNGGWATYYNDDIKSCMNFPIDSDFTGWFSSKFCVSAVSAWAAKDFKQEKNLCKV